VTLALATLCKLISGFNRSSKRKREFKEQQSKLGLPQHQPIHDEPTRWGSTYEMVERFLEQQSAMCAVLANDRKTWHLMPKDRDISIVETVEQVLRPLNQYTDALSGETSVTVSCVQPILWKIFSVLAIDSTDSSLAEQMKQLIADDLRKRYVSNEIPMILDCATYLDVRLKNTFVADSDAVKDRMLCDVERVNHNRPIAMDEAPEEAGASHCDGRAPTGKKKAVLSNLLADIRCEKSGN
jgi:hypothetical protein